VPKITNKQSFCLIRLSRARVYLENTFQGVSDGQWEVGQRALRDLRNTLDAVEAQVNIALEEENGE